MIRTAVRTTPFLLAALLFAAPASAQIVQSVNFGIGGSFPRGINSRVDGDVLVANLNQPALDQFLPEEIITTSLDFDIKKFRGWNVFGEWNIGFGDRLELGVGGSYYSRTVHSRYRDLEHGLRPSAPDIEQDLRLRVIPITAVVRFLPFGRPSDFQPYVGLGVGILNFRYSETGEFVDPDTLDIFDNRIAPLRPFVAKGTTAGPLVLGGLRMPLGGDIYAFTLEGRYQWGSGETGGAANEFLGDKIDLGGGQLNFGFLVRF
ncbi:MAG TPA: outer membrane beta-barrel protein [Vicinamibacterales bacterium]|nr:outer membrane beta-barrel protein [Vicinamibacterales bacterium]